MGKAVEHLVASTCIIQSRARLNVSTSLVDDEGVDLVFHRRGGTATLAVQVKARMSDSKQLAGGTFRQNVRMVSLKPRPDLYGLFVAVDVPSGTFDTCWFIPSADLAKGPDRMWRGVDTRSWLLPRPGRRTNGALTGSCGPTFRTAS